MEQIKHNNMRQKKCTALQILVRIPLAQAHGESSSSPSSRLCQRRTRHNVRGVSISPSSTTTTTTTNTQAARPPDTLPTHGNSSLSLPLSPAPTRFQTRCRMIVLAENEAHLALMAGSSQHGKALLASVASNCVTAMVLVSPSGPWCTGVGGHRRQGAEPRG